jgi:hypothetical protein
MTIAFREFELDEDVFELRRGGRQVVVQPKVLDVLCYLVRNRERVVTRSELFEKVYRAAVEACTLGGRHAKQERQLLLRLGAALGRDGRLAEASHAFRAAGAIPRDPAERSAPVEVPALNAAVLRDSFHVIDQATSLIATLAEAADEHWTARVQSAWTDAYLAISTTMLEGARAAERDGRAASRPDA